MALTKQQAYPLYFLLTTESGMLQNLRASNCTSQTEFLTALQSEVSKLDPSAIVDTSLAHLWSGHDPVAGNTIVDQNPVHVLQALPALSVPAVYGGGPCPKSVEQQALWNALSALP